MSSVGNTEASPHPSPKKGGEFVPPSTEGAESGRSPLVVGVDVGGTKIAAAVVDREGHILGHSQRPTDVTDTSATLASIADAIRQTVQTAGLTLADIHAVGLGIPGKVDPVAGVGVLSVNLGWRDAPVKAYLGAALGLPCAIENDVSVGALGESRYGSGRGLQSMVYLIIGTGIAARVIINTQLYRGVSGMAGEIGHTVFDPNGLRCKCGARGCLEAIASGPGIAARARELVISGAASALQRVLAATGDITAPDVFEAAAADDSLALAVLEQTGGYLGQAITHLLMLFDPQVIILGGGLAHSGPLLLAAIHRELARQAAASYVIRDQYQPDKVVVSPLGNAVALLGAAALVMPNFPLTP